MAVATLATVRQRRKRLCGRERDIDCGGGRKSSKTIGQAYEDMQMQNQHLLQQVTERDDYNIKVPCPHISDPAEKYISLIIPAFNEEHRLPGALEETMKYHRRWFFVRLSGK